MGHINTTDTIVTPPLAHHPLFDQEVHPPQEPLHTFVRTKDANRDGTPEVNTIRFYKTETGYSVVEAVEAKYSDNSREGVYQFAHIHTQDREHHTVTTYGLTKGGPSLIEEQKYGTDYGENGKYIYLNEQFIDVDGDTFLDYTSYAYSIETQRVEWVEIMLGSQTSQWALQDQMELILKGKDPIYSHAYIDPDSGEPREGVQFYQHPINLAPGTDARTITIRLEDFLK